MNKEISKKIVREISNLLMKNILKEDTFVIKKFSTPEETQKSLEKIRNACEQFQVNFDDLIKRVEKLARHSKTSKENSFNTAIAALSLYDGKMVVYTRHFPDFLDKLMNQINVSNETQSSSVIYDDQTVEFLPDTSSMKKKLFHEQDILLYRNKFMEMLYNLNKIGGRVAVNHLFYFAWEYLEENEPQVVEGVDLETKDGESGAIWIIARRSRDNKNYWNILLNRFEKVKNMHEKQRETGT